MKIKALHTIYISLLFLLSSICLQAQSFVFAQLNGAPVNTTGWNFSGDAAVSNVLATNNSEILLCRSVGGLSGAIFYSQPINLGLCNSWTAEFDFRMYDGNSADGLAFCFLDVPPTGFVTGGGLGIPGSANGLKVCFDTYNNCPPDQVPKIELRWGSGYDECWSQPTANNNSGTLSFIRSSVYNHAKITYLNGNINVYVNNNLYLSGFQSFNFAGYLGFTASTGGLYDNHSIKNVIIYTDMPPSVAGTNLILCSGGTIQLGTAPTAGNNYSWNPVTGLNNANIANPVLSLDNLGNSSVTRKYFVSTSFASAAGCASTDSVEITINPKPAININFLPTIICENTTVIYTATISNGGALPVFNWKKNNAVIGGNTATFTDIAPVTGDQITCTLSSNDCVSDIPVSIISNTITATVTPIIIPAVSILTASNSICSGSSVTFTAMALNGGSSPSYQWKLNGNTVGTNSSSYTNASLQNGDQINCELTSNANCLSVATVVSNTIIISVVSNLVPAININASANNICSGSAVSFSAMAVNGGATPIYQWQLNGINVGSNSNNYTNANIQNTDIISCNLTSNAACISTANAVSNSISMIVIPSVTAGVTITASANNVCNGTAINFTAMAVNAGATPVYQWKLNAVTVGSNSTMYSNATLQNGDVVSCVLLSNATCLLNATAVSNNITINILPTVTPAVTITANANNICIGTTVNFFAAAVNTGSAAFYQWKLNGINVGTNSNNYPNSILQNGDWVSCVLTSNASCTSISTAISNTVTMQVKPIVNSIVSITICNGQTYAGHNSTGTFIDTFISNNGCDSIRTLNLNIYPKRDTIINKNICLGTNFEGYSNSGKYTDTFINLFGCDSIRNINLLIVNPPILFLGNDTSLCLEQAFTLQAGNFDSYLWQDNSTKNSYQVSTEGLYSVRVSNICGTATDAISIISKNCGFYFPSAFTPGNANRNTTFKLLTDFVIKKYHLAVYNRWGQIIFESIDYLKGWDGNYNNKAANSGTYLWVCELTHPVTGTKIVKKGTVVLIR